MPTVILNIFLSQIFMPEQNMHDFKSHLLKSEQNTASKFYKEKSEPV
jgi:hypothetical protein